jgi:hypothetical protein
VSVFGVMIRGRSESFMRGAAGGRLLLRGLLAARVRRRLTPRAGRDCQGPASATPPRTQPLELSRAVAIPLPPWDGRRAVPGGSPRGRPA